MVDTCAAEFEAYTPYLYSTYETEDEAPPSTRLISSAEMESTGRGRMGLAAAWALFHSGDFQGAAQAGDARANEEQPEEGGDDQQRRRQNRIAPAPEALDPYVAVIGTPRGNVVVVVRQMLEAERL